MVVIRPNTGANTPHIKPKSWNSGIQLKLASPLPYPNVAHQVAALAAQGERGATARRIVLGDHGAGVEIVGDDTLVDQPQQHHAGRAGVHKSTRKSDETFTFNILA